MSEHPGTPVDREPDDGVDVGHGSTGATRGATAGATTGATASDRAERHSARADRRGATPPEPESPATVSPATSSDTPAPGWSDQPMASYDEAYSGGWGGPVHQAATGPIPRLRGPGDADADRRPADDPGPVDDAAPDHRSRSVGEMLPPEGHREAATRGHGSEPESSAASAAGDDQGATVSSTDSVSLSDTVSASDTASSSDTVSASDTVYSTDTASSSDTVYSSGHSTYSSGHSTSTVTPPVGDRSLNGGAAGHQQTPSRASSPRPASAPATGASEDPASSRLARMPSEEEYSSASSPAPSRLAPDSAWAERPRPEGFVRFVTPQLAPIVFWLVVAYLVLGYLSDVYTFAFVAGQGLPIGLTGALLVVVVGLFKVVALAALARIGLEACVRIVSRGGAVDDGAGDESA